VECELVEWIEASYDPSKPSLDLHTCRSTESPRIADGPEWFRRKRHDPARKDPQSDKTTAAATPLEKRCGWSFDATVELPFTSFLMY
jgi:hypothetical protein